MKILRLEDWEAKELINLIRELHRTDWLDGETALYLNEQHEERLGLRLVECFICGANVEVGKELEARHHSNLCPYFMAYNLDQLPKKIIEID